MGGRYAERAWGDSNTVYIAIQYVFSGWITCIEMYM